MRAIVAGSLLLCLSSATPAFADDAKEALWAAAKKGDVKEVEALLANGADVNAKSAYGQTALWFAARKGHLEVLKLLLKHKADPNAKETFYGTTALSQAIDYGDADVAKTLVEAGADGIDEALLKAAQGGRTDIVRVILDKGKVKPESLDAALTATSLGRTEIAELLKKAGAKAAPSVTIDPEILKTYAGTYENEAGTQLMFVVEQAKPALQYGGQTVSILSVVDNTTFKTGPSTLAFKREGDKVTGFSLKAGTAEVAYKRVVPGKPMTVQPKPAPADSGLAKVAAPQNWPSFRGPNASGIADGQSPPVIWDAEKSINILWKTPLPGFGHSSPIIWGDRVFVTTAVSGDPNTKLRVGLYGNVDSVDDVTTHTWHVYCLDKLSGKIVWEQTLCQGVPKIKRHTKGSHANCTPATDGTHVVVCLGSEGLYCHDIKGNLLWKRDLGVLDSSFFFDADYQWGFGSSPIIYRNLAILQCDVGKNSFIAAYDLDDGKPVWQTPREEIPSWGTPTIYEGEKRVELITNATKHVRGYDPLTGKELWRLSRNAEITVPTPIAGQGLIFVTSGYRPIQPIYAVKPGAMGDISLQDGKESNDHVAWSKSRGGPYMTTPIVYGGYLYTCANDGLVTCHEAKTGKQMYKERLGGKGGYTASPVAADGRLYFTSEENGIRVVKAGPKFEILATNLVGDVCMATPAISDGMMFVRTQHAVFGIGRQAVPKLDSQPE